jgi:hypothetical protein
MILTDRSEIEKRVLSRILHYYGRENTGKNTHKLLSTCVDLVESIGEAADAVRKDWSIGAATGNKLDILAERYGVYRQADEPDESLRERLYTEVLICTSSGSVDELKTILERVLEIPGEEIEIYLNTSPSLGIDIIDTYIEISLPLAYFGELETPDIFMFADSETVPDFDDPYGFDYGRLLYGVVGLPDTTEIYALLERIVAAGVGFTVSGYGGFMFSDWDAVSNFDDDNGFGAGMLSGVI